MGELYTSTFYLEGRGRKNGSRVIEEKEKGRKRERKGKRNYCPFR